MHRIQNYIACNKVIEQVKRLVLAISQAKLLVLFLRVITETSTSNFRVEHLVKRLINYFKAYNRRLDCSISNLWNNCSAGLRLTNPICTVFAVVTSFRMFPLKFWLRATSAIRHVNVTHTVKNVKATMKKRLSRETLIINHTNIRRRVY